MEIGDAVFFLIIFAPVIGFLLGIPLGLMGVLEDGKGGGDV